MIYFKIRFGRINNKDHLVFKAAFSNISVTECTQWQSVVLVEETKVPEENH
jgi:hypothetical protein